MEAIRFGTASINRCFQICEFVHFPCADFIMASVLLIFALLFSLFINEIVRSLSVNAEFICKGSNDRKTTPAYSDTSRILFILWIPLKADWPVLISSLLAKGQRESFS